MTFKEARLVLLLDGWEESKDNSTYLFNRGFACIAYNPHARPVRRAFYNVFAADAASNKTRFYKKNYAMKVTPKLLGGRPLEAVMRIAGYV